MLVDKRLYLSYSRNITIYLVVGFLLMWIYDKTSYFWTPIGGSWFIKLPSEIIHFKISPRVNLEYPLIFVILIILYFDKIKNQYIKYLLPIFTIVIAYIGIDFFFLHMDRIPRLSDVGGIVELRMAMPIFAFFAVLILLSIPFCIIYIFIQVRKAYSSREFLSIVLVKTLILSGVVMFMTSPTGYAYQRYYYHNNIWSEMEVSRNNGRISSLLYYTIKEIYDKNILKKFNNIQNIRKILYPGELKKKPNIYIVVLESFIDPRLLENIQFSRSPLADELMPFLMRSNGGFSHVISPVYGGGSARAGFELLTGLKSLAGIEPVEFNLMKGGVIHSLPWVLAKHGYKSISTIASNSMYFNERRAYPSLSVNNTLYLEDAESVFTKRTGDIWVFDGDLLQFNLKRIATHIEEKGTPLFNYVVGMYGHSPYHRNYQERPDVIASNLDNNEISKITNQFYYRTKALAKYLEDLKAIDPHGIVFVTSDHVPPLLSASVVYRKNRHTNIAVMLYEWTPINVSGKKYYEIPWLIWDLLRGVNTDRDISDEKMKSLYFTALKQSINFK